MSHVLRPTAMTGRPLPAARHLRGRAARTRAAARLVAAAVLPLVFGAVYMLAVLFTPL